MEEKNFTDEEVVAKNSITAEEYVKILEHCTGLQACHNCEYNDGCPIDNEITVDLIHRLQDKIAEYERKLADGELVSKEWHDEQVLHDKEEIERLKTELSESRSVINTAHYKYHDYKDYQAYCINELQEQKVELLKANAELQKQVDELKSRKIEPLIVKCPSLETCPKVERAVKDTAKELSEFKHDTISHTTCWGRKEPVTRPPQSWCYVE